MDLFVFSELVGPGLPLWTPKGTLVRNLLDDYVWSLRKPLGYEKVEIPHITKKELYETSGHWDKFKNELFNIKTREGHTFAMKPMNCPHHQQIYASRPRIRINEKGSKDDDESDRKGAGGREHAPGGPQPRAPQAQGAALPPRTGVQILGCLDESPIDLLE